MSGEEAANGAEVVLLRPARLAKVQKIKDANVGPLSSRLR